MSKYLNSDGLTYLWNKIKNYVDSKISSDYLTTNAVYDSLTNTTFTYQQLLDLYNEKYKGVIASKNSTATTYKNVYFRVKYKNDYTQRYIMFIEGLYTTPSITGSTLTLTPHIYKIVLNTTSETIVSVTHYTNTETLTKVTT